MDDFQFNSRNKQYQNPLPGSAPKSLSKNEKLGNQELWENFIHGSEEAFITVYTEQFEHLIQYGYQFRLSQEDVEDVVQELMISLRTKRKKLPKLKNSIRSYLFKSLKNRIIDKIRARQTRIRRESEAILEFEAFATIEEVMINKQEHQIRIARLDSALKTLTTHQREVIYYLYQQKMSSSEIREILQLTHDRSVRNLVYRTLEKLRSQMAIK
jgi:RNA polymerase sigma-70 factor (ECF subfamily)